VQPTSLLASEDGQRKAATKSQTTSQNREKGSNTALSAQNKNHPQIKCFLSVDGRLFGGGGGNCTLVRRHTSASFYRFSPCLQIRQPVSPRGRDPTPLARAFPAAASEHHSAVSCISDARLRSRRKGPVGRSSTKRLLVLDVCWQLSVSADLRAADARPATYAHATPVEPDSPPILHHHAATDLLSAGVHAPGRPGRFPGPGHAWLWPRAYRRASCLWPRPVRSWPVPP